jgi:hypothetical protein
VAKPLFSIFRRIEEVWIGVERRGFHELFQGWLVIAAAHAV